jgi:DNA-binding CsgD family transcriptional regulator
VSGHDHQLLLGRARELGILRRLLDGARDGRAGVMVVRGEPGIGKTALLEWLVRQASGFRVIRGLGVESEMELPFAGLHQLCAPLLGRLGSLPGPQQRALGVALGLTDGDNPDRFLVAMAALSLVAEAAEDQPLLCVVDDAHWLDQASAQVLGFVGRHLLAEPLALVLATRLSPGGASHLAGLRELTLGGLDRESAGALLGTVLPSQVDDGVRQRIVEETHGNPLALIELCHGPGPAGLAGGFAFPSIADLPGSIEGQYIARLRQLPPQTRQLLLLAAADMTAETALVYQAASVLGTDARAITPAVAAGLVEVSASVRFRHPLMRSAVYRSADASDRRAVHGALAAVTDPEADPDRRAWHHAQAAAVPDETVARELAGSAGRAQRRGGVAAAAAFWEQAVALTPDPGDRASRALTAAEAKFAAGDFAAVQALLAIAQAGPASDLDHARAQRMAAQTAFALRRGRDAPPLLLRAAQRLENLDAGLARQTYLQALIAAIYAGRLAPGGEIQQIARAAANAPSASGPADPVQLLLQGLAARLTDGYLTAAPILKQALDSYRDQPRGLEDWLGVAYIMAAMDLWDDDAWSGIAVRLVRQARANGTLGWLPFALDYLAEQQIHAGELSQATALIAESERIDPGIRAAILPYVSLLLAAWRGDPAAAAELTPVMARGAAERGEGAVLTYADYAEAILNNGLRRYDLAAKAALAASTAGELAISPWALAELAEAATRAGQPERAEAAGDQLSSMAAASGTAWARGIAARSQALTREGNAAEDLYREALDLLEKTRMTTQLARTRLCYGEWLRRQKRRTDARDQLRPAYEALEAMGARAFAERARRELQANGERVRKRSDPDSDLTPQEDQIAQLAREGQTNQEIGAQLFIGTRTVEWHLRNILAKLNITSRRELDKALTSRGHPPTPPPTATALP